MATVFYDGFDSYVTADVLKIWTASASSPVIGASAARLPSGQGATLNAASNDIACLSKTFASNYTQGLLGFAYQKPSGTMASQRIATIHDGAITSAGTQISIATNASGVLAIYRGAPTTNLLATGTTTLLAATWYYIEVKFTIHNTTGFVELHLNGAAEIVSPGNVNTRNTATAQWNGIGIGPQNNVTPSFDDVYCLDTSTGSNTTYLGPVRAVWLPLAAAGNYAQWTSNGGTNFGNVSEAFEDGDISFNQSATANQIDSFVLQDLPAGSGSVFSAQTLLTARQDGGAARTIAPLLRISATDYAGTAVTTGASYQVFKQIYDLQPVGGTPAWDIATVNAMELGYKEIS